MAYLGTTIYYWGKRQQNRLLVDFIELMVRELRTEALVDWFWFNRFGARGPHVFTLLRASAGLLPEVSSRLAQALDSYLHLNPSELVLEPREIQRHHDECRGKAQCEADRYPGLASNNSYCMFEHSPHGYPFNMAAGLVMGDSLWELTERLTLWSIQQLSTGSHGAATKSIVQFVAAVDHELCVNKACADDYWRYHATTLLPGLKRRFADEELLLSGLTLGDKNTAMFSRFWENDSSPVDHQLLGKLVKTALEMSCRSARSPWAPLREIVHSTLKQLGLPVASHVPLILFAWQRNVIDRRSVGEAL